MLVTRRTDGVFLRPATSLLCKIILVQSNEMVTRRHLGVPVMSSDRVNMDVVIWGEFCVVEEIMG